MIQELSVHNDCLLFATPSPPRSTMDDRSDTTSKKSEPVQPTGLCSVTWQSRISWPLLLLTFFIGLTSITANAHASSNARIENQGLTADPVMAEHGNLRAVSRRFKSPMLASANTPRDCDSGLFTESVETERFQEPLGPTILRARYAGVRINLLRETVRSHAGSPSNRVKLNLFEDVCFTAVLDRTQFGTNRLIWIGHAEGAPHSQVTLVAEKGILSGNITAYGRSYQVRYVGDGVHAIYRIDPNAFPREAPPLKKSSP